ncbi:unnamed protein product [Protopolystoma xenopodis]|uniref:Uncharacterized protein n=1 Tax=Protopolystoma xenopodis TaxID=117903 RepID=A0A448XF20_9PLAT|nr:unnamed protein product [Protopolystoma xenopodis]
MGRGSENTRRGSDSITRLLTGTYTSPSWHDESAETNHSSLCSLGPPCPVRLGDSIIAHAIMSKFFSVFLADSRDSQRCGFASIDIYCRHYRLVLGGWGLEPSASLP